MSGAPESRLRFRSPTVDDATGTGAQHRVPEMVRGMVMVKKAAASANKSLGALTADLADAIVWACDEVLEHGRCMDQFPLDVFQGGAGTSVNMNTNDVIANLALEHLGEPHGAYDVLNPNDHVNRCWPSCSSSPPCRWTTRSAPGSARRCSTTPSPLPGVLAISFAVGLASSSAP